MLTSDMVQSQVKHAVVKSASQHVVTRGRDGGGVKHVVSREGQHVGTRERGLVVQVLLSLQMLPSDTNRAETRRY